MMQSQFNRRSLLSKTLPAGLFALVFPFRAKARVRTDQPHMQAALDALKLARRELDQATPDKGGHRAKAIGLVDQAINQTEKGIEFDRHH